MKQVLIFVNSEFFLAWRISINAERFRAAMSLFEKESFTVARLASELHGAWEISTYFCGRMGVG
jgi:hypothetical protein